MSVKTFQVGSDNPSNDSVLIIFNHPYQCNRCVFSWMVVDKRTVLNENRERVHVRWTAKCGNEIDLIGQLNVAWLLGHFWEPASTCDANNIKLYSLTKLKNVLILQIPLGTFCFTKGQWFCRKIVSSSEESMITYGWIGTETQALLKYRSRQVQNPDWYECLLCV